MADALPGFTPLLPLVRELLDDMSVSSEDVVTLPDDRMSRWSKRLAVVPPKDREELAVQLVAVATEFAQELGERSRSIVTSLATLVVKLLGAGAAREVFERTSGGFDPTWLGGIADHRPVGSTPAPEGAVSPLQLRLPSNKSPKKGRKGKK